MQEFLFSSYQQLPSNPGIYLFLNKKKKILYVGKAKNLKKRVSSYFLNRANLGSKTKLLVDEIQNIKVITTRSELEALLLESKNIKKYSPKFNSRLTDGKTYPLIKIAVNEKYPSVLISRKADDKNSVYFGPFPNAGAMRSVLKTLRKIFPFQAVRNHPNKICLYYHLGFCPCPPVFKSPELKKDYKKNIKHIIDFLNGDSKKVLRDLEKEREAESKKENFENASKIQRRIESINIITSPAYRLFEDGINPNLKQDSLNQESEELIRYLNRQNYEISSPKRIECYDISNIQGKYAVGSMIVFENGEKDTSSYKKFKIRYTKEEPNDFAMMIEVISRRLKHPEWPYPDLIIVDGGKGQVSSALKVLKRKNFDIPLVGLAKREETIITSDLKEIHLPKDSKALLLIMRIRDEAHRFAISYHRILRSKAFTGT